MKSYPFKFLLQLVLLLVMGAFLLDIINISPFTIPLLPLFFAIISYEKKPSRKIITTIFAILLYSQVTTPLPFLFLVILSIVLLIASTAIFKVTSFDLDIIVSIAVISNIFLLFIIYSVLLFRNTGEIPFNELWTKVFFPSALFIIIAFFFQRSIQDIFRRDTWL